MNFLNYSISFLNISRIVTLFLLALLLLNPPLLGSLLENRIALVALILCFLVTSFTFAYNLANKKIETVGHLVRSYFFLSLSIVLLFGVLYYLVYSSDPSSFYAPYTLDANRDAFYFSAVTFYTVGYGDIVPRHFSKVLAVFQMVFGSVINLIVMAVAIKKFKY